jgi:hypothetical protein
MMLSEFAGKWDAQSRRWVGGGLSDRRTVFFQSIDQASAFYPKDKSKSDHFPR